MYAASAAEEAAGADGFSRLPWLLKAEGEGAAAEALSRRHGSMPTSLEPRKPWWLEGVEQVDPEVPLSQAADLTVSPDSHPSLDQESVWLVAEVLEREPETPLLHQDSE